EANDQSLVPGNNPRLGSIRFADWLSRNTSQKPAAQQTTSSRSAKVATVAALLLCGIGVLALSSRIAAADTGSTNGKEAKVTELFSKDLTDLPGKEGLMIIVDYPPGSSDPIHRHNAHGFIYLLEGSIIMQLKGGNEVTLTPGQTFYEGPEDIH